MSKNRSGQNQELVGAEEQGRARLVGEGIASVPSANGLLLSRHVHPATLLASTCSPGKKPMSTRGCSGVSQQPCPSGPGASSQVSVGMWVGVRSRRGALWRGNNKHRLSRDWPAGTAITLEEPQLHIGTTESRKLGVKRGASMTPLI